MKKWNRLLLVLGLLLAVQHPAAAQYYYNPYNNYYQNGYGYAQGYAPQYYSMPRAQPQPYPAYQQPVYSQPAVRYVPPRTYQTQYQPSQVAQPQPVPVDSNPVVIEEQYPTETQPAPAQPLPAPTTVTLPEPISGGACADGSCADALIVGGACPSGECPPIPCETKTCGRPWYIYGFGDYMYLQPRSADVPFGEILTAANPLAAPKGEVGVADPDYSTGFRVGLGGSCDNGCTIFEASYMWFNSHTDASMMADTPTAIRALTTFPGTLNVAADSNFADASYDIDFQFGDLNVKRALCRGPDHNLYLVLGGRYANLQQDFLANYNVLGVTTVTTDIVFDGVGPRAGLQGDYRFKKGFFMFGSGALNLIFGEFEANYLQTNAFAGTQAEVRFGDDRIVPVLELELGGGWASPKGRVRVSGGYYAGIWFNTMTTNGLIQGIQNANFTTNGDNLSETLSFDGMFGRVEFRY
jgi:hypothetical protein